MSGKQSLTISLSETLDISACETIHTELREGLRRADALVLDAAAASEVDVTFLQMLVAAQRSAERAGKTIALSKPPSGALAACLVRCGFTPPPGATALSEILSS